jgi:hypothetical protein
MKRYLTILAIGAAITLFFWTPSLTAAQSTPPAVLSDEALVDFPDSVTFRLTLDENTPITQATLTYQLGLNSCLQAGTQVPVEVDGPVIEWTWVMSRSGNPPPGAQMWWQWSLTDQAGNVTQTPRQELTFQDERFDWQTVETEAGVAGTPIRLHWYRGEEVGPRLLEAAVAGLERLEEDVGIQLDGDVEFFIYGDSADMRQALLYVQDWAGGVAFSEYNTILIGVPPDQVEGWGVSTVRHELAHLVIGQFARSCLGGSLPTWLSEGLAMYAEGEPDETTRRDIEMGIEFDTFMPVRSLNGAFPARGSEATSAYSQSYSLVDFLLDKYGQEKMQALLLALAGASGYDQALEQVYGFNVDGLEEAWRAAIGAPPRSIPPTPTPIVAAAIPTVNPAGAAQSQPTPASNAAAPSGPDSGASSGICALGLIPLLAIAGIAGLRQSRRRSRRQSWRRS